jgi:hypothetical protein
MSTTNATRFHADPLIDAYVSDHDTILVWYDSNDNWQPCTSITDVDTDGAHLIKKGLIEVALDEQPFVREYDEFKIDYKLYKDGIMYLRYFPNEHDVGHCEMAIDIDSLEIDSLSEIKALYGQYKLTIGRE